MRNIVVPEGMLKASEGRDACDQTENVLKAALRWLSENPIVPSDRDISRIRQHNVNHPSDHLDLLQFYCVEWQRRVFLEPEPVSEVAQ